MMGRRLRLPFFYGWVLVAIGFLTMAVGVNARTAFSLLFPPILRDFGWDSGVTAGVFSFGFLVSAVVTPFVGQLMDRRGPRLVIELGVAAMTAGLLLAPLARAPGSSICRSAPWSGAASIVSPIPANRFT
jgi:MFS family permease